LADPPSYKATPVFHAGPKKDPILAAPVWKRGEIKEEDLEKGQTTFSEKTVSPMGEVVSETPGPEESAEVEHLIEESKTPLKKILDSESGKDRVVGPGDPSGNIPIAPEKEETPTVLDKASLLAKITDATPARRAASLRFVEEGKKHLREGNYDKALERFEKSIAIDSTNAYSYYYLAKVHHHRAGYQESFNFLDVAESLMSDRPDWLAGIFAMRGRNFQAMGLFKRTDASYARALSLDPTNLAALEGISQLIGATKAPSSQ
jgi:tetratricopeptide (TPR) repeat protein